MIYLQRFYIGILRCFLSFLYLLENIIDFVFSFLEIFIRIFYRNIDSTYTILFKLRGKSYFLLLDFNQWINELDCNYENKHNLK